MQHSKQNQQWEWKEKLTTCYADKIKQKDVVTDQIFMTEKKQCKYLEEFWSW